MTGREPPEIVRRLQHRREEHLERGRIYRVFWVIAGVTVVLAGLAMVVFPGPAIVVIPVGLAMLSLEFAWAQRLLDRALEGGLDAKEAVANASTRTKVLGGVGVALALATVAFAAAVILL